MLKEKRINKTFIKETDERYTGIACIQSLLGYYGYDISFEEARYFSNTNENGNFLLGIITALRKYGAEPKGCKMHIDALEDIKEMPLILMITNKLKRQIFVVCYGSVKKAGKTFFLIGDPTKEVSLIPKQELELLWPSNVCIMCSGLIQQKKEKTNLVKTLWDLFKENRGIFLIIIILSLVISFLIVFPTFFIPKLIQKGDLINQLNFLTVFAIAILTFVLINFKNRLAKLLSMIIGKNVLAEFLKDFSHLPSQLIESYQPGAILGKYKWNQAFEINIYYLLRNGIQIALFITITLAFNLLNCAPIYAVLISLLTCILIYLISKNICKNGETKLEESIAFEDSAFLGFNENLIRFKDNGDIENSRFLVLQSHSNFQTISYQIFNIQSNFYFYLIAFSLLIPILLLKNSFEQYSNNAITLSQFISNLYLNSILLYSILNIRKFISPISKIQILYKKIKSLRFNNELNGEVNFHGLKSLEVDDFTYSKEGFKQDEIKFKLSKGEIANVTIENFKKKSQIQDFLLKSDNIKEGTILINDNLNIQNISLFSWNKLVAYVPEIPHILTGNVSYNIALSSAYNRNDIIQGFLAEYNLTNLFSSLPNGENTIIGKGFMEISNSQKKIISILRAIYKQPELLILDEPLNLLNEEDINILKNILSKIRKNMIVIIFTNSNTIANDFCDIKIQFKK